MNARIRISLIVLFGLIYHAYGIAQPLSVIAPKNNVCLSESVVNFSWNKSASLNELYKLQIATDSSFTQLITDSVTISNNLDIDLSSFQNTHLYWRVKDSTLNVLSPLSYMFVLDLPAFSGLTFWLAGDSVQSVSNLVQQWYNLGNPASNFSQSVEVRKPLVSPTLLNNHQGVSFGGGQQLEGSDNYFTDLGTEFYAVTQSNNTGNNFNFIYDQGFLGARGAGVWRSSDNLGYYLPVNFGGVNSSTATTPTAFSLLNVSTDLSQSSLRLAQNNNLDITVSHGVTSLNNSSISSDPITIGGQAKGYSASRTYVGDMYELIMLIDTVFQNELDRSIIPNYLRNKYAPYPNLGADRILSSLCQISVDLYTQKDYTSYQWSDGSVDSVFTISSSGTYHVRTTDEFGFVEYDTIIVKFPYEVLEDSISLCVGDSIALSLGLNNEYIHSWSTGSADSAIWISQAGMYYVQVTDTFGCSLSDTTYVYVDSFSNNLSLGPDRDFCLNTELTIENLDNSSNNLNIQWSTTETSPSITLTYATDTLIYVSVTNERGCLFEDSIQANVKTVESPIVEFEADTSCFGTGVTLFSTSIPFGLDIINNYTWKFPDNSLGTDSLNSDYTHNSFGSFFVTLIVNTDSGCVNQVENEVFVRQAPQANFTNTVSCLGLESAFFDESNPVNNTSIVSWQWNFNQNLSSLNSNPVVVLDSLGNNNTVKLVVTDSEGCTDSITKIIEVFPALLPDFEVSGVCLGDTTQFIETTPSFSVVNREWRFGLFNQTSDTENPSFYYPSSGSYSVNLRVENAIGCVSDTTKIVEIRKLPIVEFIAENACIGTNTSLNDQSQVLNGLIVDQVWQVDGNTLFGDSINYIFGAAQTYPISLQVEDNFGCVNAITSTLEVFDVPEVDFSFTPNYGEAPIDISFSNLSSTNAVDFFWDFGDGVGTSIEVEPVYGYSTNGTYTILLRGSTAEGCADSSFKEIPIIPTELDLALSNFSIQKTTLADGSLAYQPSVLLQNVGTRSIFNAELLLSVNNETSIAETWEGILPVGQSVFYTLDNFALIKNLELLDYLCLEAGFVNDNTELNLGNNKTCLIQQGAIQTSLLYPNPGQNEVHLDVIMENDDELSMAIYDLSGRLVLSSKNIALIEGYNKLSIATSSLQAGKYVVYLNYNDEIISHSLIIENP